MAKDCTIQAKNLTKIYGATTPLVAELLDNSIPLPDRTIVITINGKDYHRVTNDRGLVSLNINLLPGNYSTVIKFAGDGTYNPASKTVVVKILRNDTPQKTVKGQGQYFEVNQIPLNVIMSDGFSTTMGTSTKETDLLMQSSTKNAPTFYFNQGDHGVEFDISIVIKEQYYFNDLKVADHLNMYDKNNTVVSVVTDAMDVPNSKYIMTIKSKKQTSKTYSVWKLHFHQFYENNLTFENMYTDKVSTLSAQDQILVKYIQIDANSPSDAILALQQKLMYKGCWNNRAGNRRPNGVWDGVMQIDIDSFQSTAFGSGHRKNGYCDRETINALLGDDYEGTGWYYYGNREIV